MTNTMKIDAVIAQMRAGYARMLGERNVLAEELGALAKANPRGSDDPALKVHVVDLRNRKQALDAELDVLKERIEQMENEQRLDDAATRLQSRTLESAAGVTSFRVGTSPHTYERHDPSTSFLRDLFASQVHGDPAATERLSRHGQELVVDGLITERALTSGGVAAFVPPAYLQAEWAELVRAGRPTANLCRAVPLPKTGMTVNVPKLSTGTSTAVQSTENTAVSETDADDTQISASVVTIAGQQTLSRQVLERSDPGMDEVVFGDLAASYAVGLDAQVVTSILGQSGINAVTYTDATPTIGELYPKLADAVQRITSSRYAAPTAWVMHPRRWGWILAALDTAGRPLVVPGGHGPNNATGVGTGQMAGYADGSVGTLLGIPVFLDANIPTNLGGGTNEDRIILARFDDQILLEDGAGAPYLLRFEGNANTHKLSVLLIAYGYMAFTAARQPTGIAVISGTGLATPSF